MKIVFFGNNRVGLETLRLLKNTDNDIVALVVHSAGKEHFRKEIIESSNLSTEKIFDGNTLRLNTTLDAIKKLQPDLGISSFFGYILKQELIDVFPQGCINIHPALLPYNRGAYPNVWSIIDNTPAGATIHYIDAEVDTGDIIMQKKVEVTITDTGKSLYKKLEDVSIELFKEFLLLLTSGTLPKNKQSNEKGTEHRMKDVEKIDEIDLGKKYTGRELIDIIRARTFPPYKGSYIQHEGKKIYLRLQMIEEEEL